MSACYNFSNMLLKGMGTVLTLAVMAISLTFVIQANNVGRPDNRFFLTSTFLTTYESSLPQLTWNPSPEARSAQGLSDTAYGCLQAARVGEALCADYMDEAKLAGYRGCLAGVDMFDYCVQGAMRANVPQVLRYQQSDALFSAVWECAATTRLGATRGNHIAFEACVDRRGDGALEVLQDPYSDTFLGSVNWVLVFGTAMWILSSFAVYSAWAMNDSSEYLQGRVPGKPGSEKSWTADMMARGGWFVTAVGLVWNGLAVIPVATLAWRDSGGTPAASNDAPMSVQSTLLCLLFLVLSVVYFAGELWEQVGFLWNAGGLRSSRVAPAPASEGYQQVPEPAAAGDGMESGGITSGMRRMRMFPPLKAVMRTPKDGWATAPSEQSTPLFVFAWADAWVLTDALLIVGVVCTSMDVVTAELCNVFLLTLYAAVLHTAFQRLLYSGYVSEDSDSAFRGASRAALGSNVSLAGVRVMAMLCNVGSLVLVVTSMSLIWSRYSQAGNAGLSSLTLAYLILVSLAPAVYWLVVHLAQDYQLGSTGYSFPLLMYGQLAFDWGLMLRFLMTIILYSYMVTLSPNFSSVNERLGVLLTQWRTVAA